MLLYTMGRESVLFLVCPFCIIEVAYDLVCILSRQFQHPIRLYKRDFVLALVQSIDDLRFPPYLFHCISRVCRSYWNNWDNWSHGICNIQGRQDTPVRSGDAGYWKI